jgi:chromosome segregation ATPase
VHAVNREKVVAMLRRGPVRGLGRRVRRFLVPERDALVAGIDELHRRLEILEAERSAREAELAAVREGLELAQQERWQLHRRAERLETEGRRARERFGTGDADPGTLLAWMEDLDEGLHEARRLNVRIAELTDIVTELVLPLHDREIDAERLRPVSAETL